MIKIIFRGDQLAKIITTEDQIKNSKTLFDLYEDIKEVSDTININNFQDELNNDIIFMLQNIINNDLNINWLSTNNIQNIILLFDILEFFDYLNIIKLSYNICKSIVLSRCFTPYTVKTLCNLIFRSNINISSILDLNVINSMIVILNLYYTDTNDIIDCIPGLYKCIKHYRSEDLYPNINPIRFKSNDTIRSSINIPCWKRRFNLSEMYPFIYDINKPIIMSTQNNNSFIGDNIVTTIKYHLK